MTIVYCCTRNWYHYLMVSLYSLLCNNKVSKVYLFVEDDEIDGINKISTHFKTDIIVYNYKKYIDKYITKENMNKKAFSEATLIRLFISKILPDDKVIYLDIDTVIMDDISDMDKYNLEDNLVAGVQDLMIERYLDYMSLIDLPDKIINAGIMIMNLQKIRDEKIDDKWLKLINKEKYRFPDQDVINKVCQDRILFIDNKYNSSASCGYVDNMKILHYSTPKKEWVKGFPYSEIWYEWEQKYENFKSGI